MPAVYASGPALQWDGSGIMPEAEQVEPIFLNALEEAFCHEDHIPDYTSLLEVIRSAFSRVSSAVASRGQLVPDVAESSRPQTTFRDSAVLLPWLFFDSLHLPTCHVVPERGFRLMAPEAEFPWSEAVAVCVLVWS